MSRDNPRRRGRKEPERFLEMEDPPDTESGAASHPEAQSKPKPPETQAKPRRPRRPRPRREQPVEIQPPRGVVSETWETIWAPSREPWKPVTGLALGTATAAFGYLWYLMAVDPGLMDRTALRFLHRVNLVFHEFGHPAFGLFGDTIGILGGTLGQLLIPFIVAVAFWRQRDTVGFALGLFWFFENFLDVAVYMADARALRLPLIGGLGAEAHDWRNLFMQWGVLYHDTRIAGITRALGWIGMIGVWLWLGWRWLTSDRKPNPRGFHG